MPPLPKDGKYKHVIIVIIITYLVGIFEIDKLMTITKRTYPTTVRAVIYSTRLHYIPTDTVGVAR